MGTNSIAESSGGSTLTATGVGLSPGDIAGDGIADAYDTALFLSSTSPSVSSLRVPGKGYSPACFV